MRKTLAVHREKVEEEAQPPTGKWYDKDSTGQVPLFFLPMKDKKKPPKFSRNRLNLDLRANFPSENEQLQGKGWRDRI